MKFAKIAKDITGEVLHEGDVLQYMDEGHATTAVISKIVQRNRNDFPNLQVKVVSADWRGKNVKVRSGNLNVETYKTARTFNTSLLRDDIPLNVKIKEVQESILAKTPTRRS